MARTEAIRWNLGDPLRVVMKESHITNCEIKEDKSKKSIILMVEVRLVNSSEEVE